MNQDQADAEAKRRWGPDAQAKPYGEDSFEIIVDVSQHLPNWKPKKFGPLNQVLGMGNSWEEALKNAIEGKQFAYNLALNKPTATEPTQLSFLEMW